MEPVITIGKHTISRNHTPYIIAEIGANHCGDADIMAHTIRAAMHCGADAVKLQTWTLESLFSPENVTSEDAATIRSLQLSSDQLHEVKRICDSVGIDLILSVFSLEEALFAEQLEVVAIKIASMDLVHHPLLKAVGQLRPPVIMSTGMSNINEVVAALDALGSPPRPCVLMHCASVYPPTDRQLALGSIDQLRATFGVPVGFSDHTTGLVAPVAATALGACMIEKHFALHEGIVSWDSGVSIVPGVMKQMVSMVEYCFQAVQYSAISGEELDARYTMRRSIVAAHDLPEGHEIQWPDIEYKRPGDGIWPDKAKLLVGSKVASLIACGEQVSWDRIQYK